MMGKERHHLLARSVPQARERDMGRELARLGFQADALQGRLDLLLQMEQRFVGLDARPERSRDLAAEFARAGKLEHERRSAETDERIVDVMRHVLVDLADEAQGQVHLILGHPARARNAALKMGKSIPNNFRQFERDEEPDHDHAFSGSRRRRAMTASAYTPAPAAPAMTKAARS